MIAQGVPVVTVCQGRWQSGRIRTEGDLKPIQL